MAIYRGVGGAGDISSGITLNEVTELTLRAEDAAVAAEASATTAAAAQAGVAADANAAASSATESSESATDSAESATDSENSAISAAATLADFATRYIGASNSAPATSLVGALYFNTNTNELFVWTGAAWAQSSFTADSFLTAGDIGVTVQGYDANTTTTTNTQTLTNKTLVDPVITLGSTQGVLGQFPVSQGAGLPPVWTTPESGFSYATLLKFQ
jgi:hypothetical protein